MLLPPFRGPDLQGFDHDGHDITDELFAPNGFLKVDADYTPKPLRAVAGQRLAEHLRQPDVPQRLRRRYRLRPAPPDLTSRARPPPARSSLRLRLAPGCRPG